MQTVTRHDIELLAEKIRAAFSPDMIVLMGSHARGDASPDSDVDLLVVLPYEGTNFRKAIEIVRAVQPSFAVDILIRAPHDLQDRFKMGDPIVREALTRGEVIYKRVA